MIHTLCRVTSFEIVAPYTLRVGFDDASQQIIDFYPILTGELYSPLRDLALFNQVTLDPEVHTLVWPNGADFDPATLHDWTNRKHAFIHMAKQWEHSHLSGISEREQEQEETNGTNNDFYRKNRSAAD
jgi:hypothetical protein